jgi:predicted Fe-Mo cluster-binding NifX family protein
MRIAIPLFLNRVSPRCDFAEEVMIVTVEQGNVTDRKILSVGHLTLSQRLDQLKRYGVERIICGGLDDFSLSLMKSRGFEVMNNVVGEAEGVLESFMKGTLQPGFPAQKR